MHYKMTTPCDACPFLKGSGFTLRSLIAHARGEFACHKQCDLVEDEDGVGIYQQKPNNKSAHCAGALIFNEKRDAPHQMMRIAERLGLYDHTQLDMTANVGTTAKDFRR